tara:strand:+ start:44 stop:355 length:312 start_codon:yes stop_codon:yes gene_type:complete
MKNKPKKKEEKMSKKMSIEKMSDVDLEIAMSKYEQELESRRRLKKRKELFIELLKYNKDVELYDVKENDHNSYRLLFKYKDEVNVIDLRQLVSDLKKYKKVSQ